MQTPNLTPILILQMTFFAVLHGAKWTYNDGEHHWSENYPFCGGAFQSPIDIHTDLLRFDPSLRPIEVRNYNLTAHEQLTLGNNGHSLQLSLPSKMHISGLPHRYTAAQLHFHWGSPHQPIGSEHTVNGKRFAAEMHVVHFNSDKYANVSTAVDKSDGLAVLGVLLEVGEFNPYFERFLKYINGIKYRDQRVQVPGFNIRRLLPARLDEYYRYDGSLTTPPCYPSVLWTVFRNPVTISHKQFLSLATALYSSHVQESVPVALNGNYRKPQHHDNRVVLVSFKEGRGLHGTVTVTSPLMRKQIIQQLLAGDLADLADERLYQLLPMVPDKASAGETENDFKHDWTQTSPEQQWMNPNMPGGTDFVPSLKKDRQARRHMAKAGLTKDTLCYLSLEHKVLRQLRRTHTESQLVQALKDEVFPGLNLRSYLECKSDLAFSTIRQILRGRPTDEAFELDQSLTKASKGQRKSFPAMKLDTPVNKNTAHSPANVPGTSHSQIHQHPWLVPMEQED